MLLLNFIYGNMCIRNTKMVFYCQYLIRIVSIAGAAGVAFISTRSFKSILGAYSRPWSTVFFTAHQRERY